MTDDLYAQRMTAQEAVALCRMAKAACPQQQFDEYTPDMWHELLGDLRFQDAREALVMVVKSQPFVSPAEIRDSIESVRRERIARYGPLPQAPHDIEDNWPAYQRWMILTKRAIGDGEIKPGEPLEDPRAFLNREMPNWDRVFPEMPAVTRGEVVAEVKQARPADWAARKAAAQAELAARPAVPLPDEANGGLATPAMQEVAE